MKQTIFVALTLLLVFCVMAHGFGKEALESAFLQKKEAVSVPLSAPVSEASTSLIIIDDGEIETIQNITKRSQITAYSEDGGTLRLQLVARPQKGEVVLEGMYFIYRPYKDMTGFDFFTVTAINEYGEISREATISVDIQPEESSFSYADMGSNPSAYAAAKLHYVGVYTGKKMGGDYFFQPSHTMTRGDFLVLTLTAAGLADVMQPTVNTGLPNDSDFPSWLKPYIAAAVTSGILRQDTPFRHTGIPTRAEAALLTSLAAGIGDVKDYRLQMQDVGDIPEWALPSYKELAAYRMLDLYDDFARPQQALTNSYAADLSWQLYKHCHR